MIAGKILRRLVGTVVESRDCGLNFLARLFAYVRFAIDDARVVAQRDVELPVSDVDRVDPDTGAGELFVSVRQADQLAVAIRSPIAA